MSAAWLIAPALLAIGVLALVLGARGKDDMSRQRFSAAGNAFAMAALVWMQVHANLRGEAEIREEVAALMEARPLAQGERARDTEQVIRRSRLEEIVSEADRMGPWLLILSSVALGGSLVRVLDAGRRKVGSKGSVA